MFEGLAGFPTEVLRQSNLASKVSKTINKKMLSAFMSKKEIASMEDVYFLGSGSAKVMHSAEEKGYLNVVQYLAPADMAATSLLIEFPELRHEAQTNGRLHKLDDAIRVAAKADPLWVAFAKPGQTDLIKRESQRLAFIEDEAKDHATFVLPDFKNNFVSLCPFASADCRRVCLNTSGQGGMARTGGLTKSVFQPAKAAGYTVTDDLTYLYARGYKAFYGGASNSVIGARLRRTHIMLLSWLREGVLDNTYNQMIYGEAMRFAERANNLRAPIALRLNGTSDFPAHTLKVGGRNLMQLVSAAGVMCYDYTKHYEKVHKWMNARAFNLDASRGTMLNGFPSNYHLSMSWSENNAAQCLKVLHGGGNVVMVFRRSIHAKTGKADVAMSKQATVTTRIMPTEIAVAQLSKAPEDKNWIVEVVDGDAHDLRFLDPYNVGKKDAGMVVGLIAKGKAMKAYRTEERRETWKHFTSPVMLKRIGSQIRAEVVSNPGEPGAVAQADAAILNASTEVVDGWQVGTTAMGT